MPLLMVYNTYIIVQSTEIFKFYCESNERLVTFYACEMKLIIG